MNNRNNLTQITDETMNTIVQVKTIPILTRVILFESDSKNLKTNFEWNAQGQFGSSLAEF